MRNTFVVLGAAALLFAACSKQATNSTPIAAVTLPADVRDLAKPAATKPAVASRPAVGVETPAASPAEISATGELISPERSEVTPRQPGRVATVYVREGAHVRAGQPLAEFESEYYRLDLKRAEAELERAKSVESDASRDLARKRDLITTQSISQAALDHAQSSYESAVASREAARAIVATIRQRIADATLRAPFDGIVETKSVDAGEHVGDGQAAFVIVQTSSLKLRFRLPEQYLGNVHEGQRVNASTDTYAHATFSGRITMIGGVIDPSTRTLVAEADINNSDGRLRPGMFARVTIAQ